MKKIKLIAALLSALFLTGCVDQSGNQSADNDTKEKRIVATSVATCEILDKLEVEGVVGVPKTDSYSIPKRYENAESVGSPMAPDMEIIKSLKPDIVLSPNSLEGELKSQYENERGFAFMEPLWLGNEYDDRLSCGARLRVSKLSL